jgi:hypothetical protein
MNQGEEDRELYEQAEALARQFQALTLEANTVRTQLIELNSKRARREAERSKPTVAPKRTRSIQVGDRVVVTNKYKGRQGTVGTVTKLTKTQAYVNPDGDGETFRCYKANLKKI